MAAQIAGVPNPWVMELKCVSGLWTEFSKMGWGCVLPMGERSWARRSWISLTICLQGKEWSLREIYNAYQVPSISPYKFSLSFNATHIVYNNYSWVNSKTDWVHTPNPFSMINLHYLLGRKNHIFSGMEYLRIVVLFTNKFCERFGRKFCFTHVSEISSKMDSFTWNVSPSEWV